MLHSSIHQKSCGFYITSVIFPVDILLKATGNAPIMKKKKWAVDAEKPIGWIMEFVKKYLKLEPDEKLVSVVYNNIFCFSATITFVHTY